MNIRGIIGMYKTVRTYFYIKDGVEMGIETVDALINEVYYQDRFTNKLDKLNTACREHGVEYTIEDLGYIDNEEDESIRHYQIKVEKPEPHGLVYSGVLERVKNRNLIYIDSSFQTSYIEQGVDMPPDLSKADLLCAYCDGVVPLVKGVLVYDPTKENYYILSRSCYSILTYFDQPIQNRFTNLVDGYAINDEGVISRVHGKENMIVLITSLVQASLDYYFKQESADEEGVYNWESYEGNFYQTINKGTVAKVKEHMGKFHKHVIKSQVMKQLDSLQEFMVETKPSEEENIRTCWEVGVPESRQGFFIYLTWLYYHRILKGIENKYELEKKLRETRRKQYQDLKDSSVFEGVVGDVLETEGEIIRIGGYATQYGYTSILTIQSKEGNAIVWKTTTIPNVHEGDYVTIKGRIKEHSEYNGLNQTIVTRAKLGVAKTD